jgi:hypothetical protein
MRDSDQLDECAGGFNLLRKRSFVQGIAKHGLAIRGEFSFRSLPHQSSNVVSALSQPGNQVPADITGAAGHKDLSGTHAGEGWPQRSF